MATKPRNTKTADAVILGALGYEFPLDDRSEAEQKIRRRLRYHGAGPYRQERVDLLRRLKDEIQGEVHKGTESGYFVGSHGQYAAMEDFDVQRMARDMARSYPRVAQEEIAAFISFAVYLYHLR